MRNDHSGLAEVNRPGGGAGLSQVQEVCTASRSVKPMRRNSNTLHVNPIRGNNTTRRNEKVKEKGRRKKKGEKEERGET